MPPIAQYLLKLSISIAVVYLFYALVLRRLTFHMWNRWYLLGYSLLAFFIPFVNISPMLEQGAWNENMVVQLIPVMGNYETAPPANTISGWDVFLFLLITGVVFMLIRLLIQYLSLRKIRRSSQLISDGTVKIYQVDKSIIPFSFGHSIFINQHQHSEAELREIIRHEFIHVKQRHTTDILWSELLCMLNWYNPFAWLIRRSIRQNLEFIADHQVLMAGLDRKQYQYLLLKVMGTPAFAIASQFNFSSLKKRIAMMNKMRSAKVHLIKFLFVLPLLTVLLLAFRSVAIDRATAAEAQSSMKEALTVTEDQPVADNEVLTVTVQDTVPVKGKVTEVRVTSTRIPTATASFDSTMYFIDASKGGPGRPQRTITFNYDNILYVIDGVEQEKRRDVLKDIDPNDIESIDVLKGPSAIKEYGEKGSEGVIKINTKKGVLAPKPVALPVIADTTPAAARPIILPPTVKVIKIDGNDLINGTSKFAGVLIIDGVEYDSADFRLSNLKPEDIRSIHVLKGPEAEKEYGERAKNGVIKIITKKSDDKITVAPLPARPVSLLPSRSEAARRSYMLSLLSSRSEATRRWNTVKNNKPVRPAQNLTEIDARLDPGKLEPW